MITRDRPALLRNADSKLHLLQVISITLWISLCTWGAVFTAMMLLVPYVPFMAALREHQISGIASLAAMLMVARSPASAVCSLRALVTVLPLFAEVIAIKSSSASKSELISVKVRALKRQSPVLEAGVRWCLYAVYLQHQVVLQIAVVKETGGKGPYCSLILAVVVMKDVLVFICFALNLEFARMVSAAALQHV